MLKADKTTYAQNETIITVSVAVKNTGKVDGKEVVQLYASKSDSKVTRAAQELKGFQKTVLVKAGNSEYSNNSTSGKGIGLL
jgi:beta-glucosidase